MGEIAVNGETKLLQSLMNEIVVPVKDSILINDLQKKWFIK